MSTLFKFLALKPELKHQPISTPYKEKETISMDFWLQMLSSPLFEK
jgi:hypothetical protein